MRDTKLQTIVIKTSQSNINDMRSCTTLQTRLIHELINKITNKHNVLKKRELL